MFDNINAMYKTQRLPTIYPSILPTIMPSLSPTNIPTITTTNINNEWNNTYGMRYNICRYLQLHLQHVIDVK